MQEQLPAADAAVPHFDAHELEALFGLMEHNVAPLRRLAAQHAKEVSVDAGGAGSCTWRCARACLCVCVCVCVHECDAVNARACVHVC